MIGSHHILLIEDDPGIAGSLQTALIREGYTVNWRAEGQSGVAYARDHNPHLIILDLRLPDGSGFDFCREMRKLGVRQPIIMLTGFLEENRESYPYVDEVLYKPTNLAELRRSIAAALTMKRSTAQSVTNSN